MINYNPEERYALGVLLLL